VAGWLSFGRGKRRGKKADDNLPQVTKKKGKGFIGSFRLDKIWYIVKITKRSKDNYLKQWEGGGRTRTLSPCFLRRTSKA